MDSHDIEKYFASHKSILAVLLIIVGIVSVSGFFMGMRQSGREGNSSSWTSGKVNVADKKEDYSEAPLYKNIPETTWKANEGWINELANLPEGEEDLSPRKALTAPERAKILEARVSRRAYDGAPPTIPHAINNRDVQSCTACHDQDSHVVIAGKRVASMSHPYLSSCTQCHAPTKDSDFAKKSQTHGLEVANLFTGNKRTGKGSRAYPGAPPTMPHRVSMRQNCMSCHGPGMPDAIVTSHPQRSNCLQCHAENSNYDNREKTGALQLHLR